MQEKLTQTVKHRVSDEGLRLILRHLWQEKRLFVLTVFFTGLGALFEGAGIGLLIPFLESLLQPDQEPLATGWVWFDQNVLWVDASTVARLYWFTGMILGTVVLRGILAYLGSLVSITLQRTVVAKLRREVIDQIQSVSLRFFSTRRTGSIINTLNQEVSQVNNLLGTSSTILIRGSMAIVYAGALFALAWPLAIAALGICAILFGVMSLFLGALREEGRKLPKANARVTSIATELIRGIRTVFLSGTQQFEADRFREATEEVKNIGIRMGRRNALAQPISQSVATTALMGIVIVAVQYFVLPGHLSAAALLTFLFALFRLLPIVRSLNGLRGQWATQRGALENVAEFLRTEDKPYLEDGHVPLRQFEHGIEVQHVSFSYLPDQPVLRDVSFRIDCGETVAFVGASGAGKSTLADVLMRLYDPTEGRILIDGRDLRAYTLDSLRDHIAAVSQDTFLFNDTVYNNLTYGIGDLPMDEVRAAAQHANALEFIEELEVGFDTQLGDRGVRLSGGQRQRIAIARALLRDPEILVLDEATSSLDSVTEKLVQESLDYLMEGRTVVVIAHRLSTIENADKVIVLEEGRIVEQGAYDELVVRGGQFAKYHDLQFQAA
jgi:subfamily B ATP-binding cassette protein MsbA